jgi:polyvinyl alcohol dehydrogenase (cytochrome)
MGLKSVFVGGLLFAVAMALTPEARADWPMFNHDHRGTRHNPDEWRLDRHNVGKLAVKWSFPTAMPVGGTPAVTDGTVFVGDFSGAFYALRAHDGALRWQAQVEAGVTASAMVKDGLVIFGDQGGYIYGLDEHDGSIKWKVRPNPHPEAAIWGSGTPVGRYVAFGVASNEWEIPEVDPSYPCCSFRGSVVMLDPKDGSIVWETYLITPQESAAGASGASVWSTPTYDPDLGLVFVGSGNNYTDPTTGTSDSLIAFDAETGLIAWVNQRTQGDSWNGGLPIASPHVDYDIPDSPQIYRLPNGKKVVGAGSKSGFYSVVEAATGQFVNTHQFQVPAYYVGGLFSDSAVVDGIVYADSANYLENYGEIIAFTGDAKEELWRFRTSNGPDLSGVAVANEVVYFSSYDGNLYALDTQSGTQLAQIALGAQSSGPAVTDGRVYLGTGNTLGLYGLGPLAPATIVALALPDDDDFCDDDD